MVLFITISNSTFSQIRHSDRGFSVQTGLVVLPFVEGNGALGDVSASAIVGVGTFLKFDAVTIEGGLSYVPTKEKLYTVGAKLMFELPVREGGIRFPYSAGFCYRMFVSVWDIHCAGLALKYEKKNWVIGPEFGFATKSLKTGRETTGYAVLTVGYKLDWRY